MLLSESEAPVTFLVRYPASEFGFCLLAGAVLVHSVWGCRPVWSLHWIDSGGGLFGRGGLPPSLFSLDMLFVQPPFS